MIYSLDVAVGVIKQALVKKGLWENTILVFSSGAVLDFTYMHITCSFLSDAIDILCRVIKHG
jgi:hypothetical protein